MIPDEAVDAAVEIPESMRGLLDEANAAYWNANRRAHERWLERSRP